MGHIIRLIWYDGFVWVMVELDLWPWKSYLSTKTCYLIGQIKGQIKIWYVIFWSIIRTGPTSDQLLVRSGFFDFFFFFIFRTKGKFSKKKKSFSEFLVRTTDRTEKKIRPGTDYPDQKSGPRTGPRNPDQKIRTTYRTKFMSGPNSGPRTGPRTPDQKIRTT